MTEKREHVKMNCSYCSCLKRSFDLPAHLIENHMNEIYISPAQPNHCLFAYFGLKHEIGFYFCFTCRKGIINISADKHMFRCLSMHDKKGSCKKSHRALLHSFKIEQKQHQESIRNETESPVHDVSCQSDTIDNLWNTLKNKKQLKNFMNDIEQTCADLYSDESDNYIFNASQGFEDCIANAIGYKKEYETLKKNDPSAQLEIEYEKELIEMRDRISFYKNKAENCLMAMIEKNAEIAELQATNQQLIAEKLH